MQTKFPVVILDALQNVIQSSPEYSRGLLVGVVSGIMAYGLSFDAALLELRRIVGTTRTALKWSDVLAVMPDSWRASCA